MAMVIAALLLAGGAGWVVLAVVSVLLLAGLGVVLWMVQRGAGGGRADAGARGEMEQMRETVRQLLRDAEQGLAGSQRAGTRSLKSATLVYVLGAANAAKTTTVLRSAMEPELLAGEVQRDGGVLPTRLGNVWYTEGGVLVEAGETLRRGEGAWPTLLRRLRPGLVRSAAGSSAAARAAVVCVSCESFFGADAAEAVRGLAAETNAMLRVAARELGDDLPVYVLFTKLDRMAGFAEFVGRLRTEEVTAPLGASLPRGQQATHLYGESAAAEVSRGLDRLLFSLGEFRLEALSREASVEAGAAIYEFPREMTKLRNNLLTYLVEVARPTHLSANPYLRGFYFTGVRSHAEETLVSAPAAVEERRQSAVSANATQVFSIRESRVAEYEGPRSVTHKVAQWCFLPHFFSAVVFADAEALGRTREPGRRASLLRRWALATACAVMVVLLVGTTTSFVRNRALEAEVRDAAENLPAGAPLTGLASEGELQQLDRLRGLLAELERNETEGAPWSLRWGLYHGEELMSPARAIYFDRFQRVLLARTQGNMVRLLRGLPATAPADAEYGAAYAPLRGYLITTAYPERSTVEFLPPVLLGSWLNGERTGSGEQVALAERQFAFYAAELVRGNPYHTVPVMPAVTNARGYLNSFGSLDRVYQNILAAANGQAKAVEFNRMFSGSAATVVDAHVVPGAFTQQGYGVVKAALEHPERYFTGESWVLGNAAAPALQPGEVQSKLGARYAADFGSQWKAFLHAATVVRARSLPEAKGKLQSLASPGSALLELFWTMSKNTAVGDAAIAKQFQPAQVLVPPASTDRLIGSGNSVYVNGLQGLEGAIAQFVQDPSVANSPGAAQPVIAAAVAAHGAVGQTAQNFSVDQSAHVEQTVTSLLQAPITAVEEVVRSERPEQMNAAARPFCSALGALAVKYPFSRSATTEATGVEVAAVLQPGTGSLWQLYEASLKGVLQQQGDSWVVVPNGGVAPTTAFVRLFGRLAALSKAMFAGGGQSPTLQFAARLPRNKEIQSVTLGVDGQQLSGADVSREFTWSLAGAGSAQLLANYGSGSLPLQFNGPWSLFHLVDHGTVESGSPLRLAYPLEISRTPIVVQGTPLTERVELSGAGASVLAPGALDGLRCPAQVAR